MYSNAGAVLVMVTVPKQFLLLLAKRMAQQEKAWMFSACPRTSVVEEKPSNPAFRDASLASHLI